MLFSLISIGPITLQLKVLEMYSQIEKLSYYNNIIDFNESFQAFLTSFSAPFRYEMFVFFVFICNYSFEKNFKWPEKFNDESLERRDAEREEWRMKKIENNPQFHVSTVLSISFLPLAHTIQANLSRKAQKKTQYYSVDIRHTLNIWFLKIVVCCFLEHV